MRPALEELKRRAEEQGIVPRELRVELAVGGLAVLILAMLGALTATLAWPVKNLLKRGNNPDDSNQ